MSGINGVSQSDYRVLNGWVCRSQPSFVLWTCVCLCVCATVFISCRVLSLLQNKPRCCSAPLLPCALKYSDVNKGQEKSTLFSFFFFFARLPEKKLRELQKPQSVTQDSLPHRAASALQSLFAQWSDCLHDAAVQWSPRTTRLLSSPWLFPFICFSQPPLKERNICSWPMGDILNTGSF